MRLRITQVILQVRNLNEESAAGEIFSLAKARKEEFG
jgi:hypothetical protein